MATLAFNDLKFVTRKWIEVNDLLGGQYSVYKNIRFKTSTLRSDLCDYNDAYIAAEGTIKPLAAAAEKDNVYQKLDNAPFRSCISKINYTLIANAEVIDIVMPMYNLLEYSHNY